jgi:hypothetical protein
VYWGLLTLLIGVGVASGGVSATRVVLPIVLIALYAYRGLQIFKGDQRAARSILWLHGIGGVMAVVQMASGSPVLIVLQGGKLLVHIFGGVAALLLTRKFGSR